MKIRVEHSVKEEIILRCPDAGAPHIRALLVLLADAGRRIPVRTPDEQLFLSPGDVLYAEFVDRSVFICTRTAVYATPLSLAQLEALSPSFFRCAKSMLVRVSAICRLKSQPGGRIMATLLNDERILISRHYAGALRRLLAQTSEKEHTP